ncbi:MAG: glycosyltransferase family 2 protein [bacterium]
MSALHRVTAVVVARDGAVWLPHVLTMLAGQTRHPDSVVGVDAGSRDVSRDILVESLGQDRVVSLDVDAHAAPGSGFGGAVNAGLASGVLRSDSDEAFDVDATEWIWLLHDDAAPAPDALERLLEGADDHPRAVILGPKARGWHDRRLLLEVGFTVTGSGRRYTGLERREHDQGQHDQRSEVHAVGSAGMLVRRDAWDDLGGFDPALPLYRDDLDLCWRAWRAGHEVRVVPAAVINHREASYHGRREGSTDPAEGYRLDRRSGMYVLLTQAPAWRLPFTALRLALDSLLRSLLFVLGKDIRHARDELLALGSALAHPGRLRASRRATGRTSVLSSRAAVGEFRPRVRAQVRTAIESVGGIVASGGSAGAGAAGALESGPVSDDADLFEDPAGGWLRRTLARPAVALTLALLVLALVAGRTLWWGEGVLFGGALLPSPEGAGDLWSMYLDAWHDVGPGSTTPTPPAYALLAAFSTLLLGKAPLAVSALLLLAVPAAAISAWWSLRGVVVSAMPRAWASITWALLPAVTGALAGGLLGTLGAAILLPPTARAVVRALGYGGPPSRAASSTGEPARAAWRPWSGRTVWWAALLVAASTACVPLTWPFVVLAVVAALVAAVVASRGGRPATNSPGSLALRGAALVLVPLVLLLPWSLHLLSQPALLLSQPGLIDGRLALPAASVLDLLLLQPGGPAAMPAWIGGALVLVALLGLLRPDRRSAALVAWAVGAVALVVGIVMLAVRVEVPGIAQPQPLWPGVPTLILGGAVIVAAALAADGLKGALESASFDFVRTPLAYVLPWVALIAPLLWAAWWVVPGAGDPVRRGQPDVLPPFVAAEAVGPQAPRTLLLRADPASGTYYTLVNGAGLSLGDADTSPPTSVWQPVDDLVSGLVSGRGGAEVAGLARYAVRYVVLDAADTSPSLVRTLDAVPGLRRLAGRGNEVLWKVEQPTARVQQADAADPPLLAAIPVQDLVSADPLVDASLPEPGPGRVLLSQTADGGWFATVGGEALAATAVDGLQEFEVAAGVGAGQPIALRFDDAARGRWLVAQFVALLVVIVLALPARRRVTDDDVADVEPDEDDVAALVVDGIVPADDAPVPSTVVPGEVTT